MTDNRALFCQNPQDKAFEEPVLEGNPHRILGFSE